MHSDWLNGKEILQGRWQHGEKVGYCYSSGLEKTLYKWEVYVPLVTKGLTPPTAHSNRFQVSYVHGCFAGKCILTGSTE
jgi:hypothetical protein